MPNLQPFLNFDCDEQHTATKATTTNEVSEACPTSQFQYFDPNHSTMMATDVNGNLDGDDGAGVEITDPIRLVRTLSNTGDNAFKELVKRSRTASNASTTIRSRKPQGMIIKQQAPTFLMIESLVWMVCKMSESNVEIQRKLFTNICHSLKNFKVLGDSYLEESLQPMRDKFSMAFDREMNRQRSLILGNSNQLSDPKLDLHFLQGHSIQCPIDIDRYKEEFIEIDVISKGGS